MPRLRARGKLGEAGDALKSPLIESLSGIVEVYIWSHKASEEMAEALVRPRRYFGAVSFLAGISRTLSLSLTSLSNRQYRERIWRIGEDGVILSWTLVDAPDRVKFCVGLRTSKD